MCFMSYEYSLKWPSKIIRFTKRATNHIFTEVLLVVLEFLRLLCPVSVPFYSYKMSLYQQKGIGKKIGVKRRSFDQSHIEI